MAQQSIENFWNICEEQLKLFTNEFNSSMGSKGFKVEYKILNKTPYRNNLWTYYELSPTFIKSRGHSSQLNACSSGNYN